MLLQHVRLAWPQALAPVSISSDPLHSLPYPGPHLQLPLESTLCNVTSFLPVKPHTPLDLIFFFFPWVANWTLDECSSKDGFRVRQVLNVHCGLLTPPSGARDGLVTTFNCHIDVMILRSPWVMMSILKPCLEPDQS